MFSVDLRDNQLDEIVSQSILADLPAVHCGPAVSESDVMGCQIGSPQLVAEAQIPNLPTSVVDQTPVIGSSQVQIPNPVTAAPAVAGDQPVNVSDNVISIDVVLSDSDSDGLIVSSDNDSESISEYTRESINANTSESSNLNNLVSPGSSLGSVPLAGISGVTKAPASSSNSVSGAFRVSSVLSGLRVPKAAVSGVKNSSVARPSGFRPGLRKVVQEWTQIARGRKR